MKKLKVKLKDLLVSAVLTLALLTPLALPQLAHCQDRSTRGSINSGNVQGTFNMLSVFPTANNQNTNCFTVYDKTGTNYFRLSPTNACQISYRVGGVLYTGVTVLVSFGGQGTNLGTGQYQTNLYFKNGLLVNGP